ncbi:unnamed protein product [Moneuplotes crassus]|uniref:Uncharacterized protein n=1 Tax=Euplotes crassus TaxID=5936 RepID=A0AAD1XS75_EUPCR|nr:unnamed protein product [Moneuplotes crassus]
MDFVASDSDYVSYASNGNDSDEYVPPEMTFEKPRKRGRKAAKKEREKLIDNSHEAIQKFYDPSGLRKSSIEITEDFIDIKPEEVENFKREYESTFLENVDYEPLNSRTLSEDDITYFNENTRSLCRLHKIVQKAGGANFVFCNNLWEQVADKVGYPFYKDAIDDYRLFFFVYDIIKDQEFFQRVSRDVDKVMIQDVHAQYLLEVSYFFLSPLKEIKKVQLRLLVETEAAVVRSFEHSVGLTKEFYHLESLYPLFKYEMIRVCSQMSFRGGVMSRTESNGIIPLQQFLMKIADPVIKPTKDDQVQEDNTILHCGFDLNIAISRVLINDLINKIPEEINFFSNKNMLKMHRQNIFGVTLPSMSIYMKNSWMGAYIAPHAAKFYSINHGPAEMEWVVIAQEDIPKLEKVIYEVYSTDFSKMEGSLCIYKYLLLAHHIPTYTVIQREGDLFSAGAGSLIMAQSHGYLTMTSWNFISKDFQQIKACFERALEVKKHAMNNQISWYTLVMDCVNKSINDFDKPTLELIYQNLKSRFTEEEQFANRIKKYYFFTNKEITEKEKDDLFSQEPENSNIINCEKCGMEILNYWVHSMNLIDPNHEADPINYVCLVCALKRIDLCRNNTTIRFYKKFDAQHAESLLSRILNKIRDPECRDEGEIKELSTFTNSLEMLKSSMKAEESINIHIRPPTHFKRPVSLSELKAKAIKEIEVKAQEKAEEKPEEPKEPEAKPEPTEPEKAPEEKKENDWDEAVAAEGQGDWDVPEFKEDPTPTPSGWVVSKEENSAAQDDTENIKEENKEKFAGLLKKDIKSSLLSLANMTSKDQLVSKINDLKPSEEKPEEKVDKGSGQIEKNDKEKEEENETARKEKEEHCIALRKMQKFQEALIIVRDSLGRGGVNKYILKDILEFDVKYVVENHFHFYKHNYIILRKLVRMKALATTYKKHVRKLTLDFNQKMIELAREFEQRHARALNSKSRVAESCSQTEKRAEEEASGTECNTPSKEQIISN